MSFCFPLKAAPVINRSSKVSNRKGYASDRTQFIASPVAATFEYIELSAGMQYCALCAPERKFQSIAKLIVELRFRRKNG